MKLALRSLFGTTCLILCFNAQAQNAFPSPKPQKTPDPGLCKTKFAEQSKKIARLESRFGICKDLARESSKMKVGDVTWGNYFRCLDLSEKHFSNKASYLALRCARKDHNAWVVNDMSFCEANIKTNLPKADIGENCLTELKGKSFIDSSFNICVQNVHDLKRKDDEKLEICAGKNGHYRASCYRELKVHFPSKDAWKECAKYDVSVASSKPEFNKCMSAIKAHTSASRALNFCSDRDADKAMSCLERGLVNYDANLLVSKCLNYKMRTHVRDWRLKSCHDKALAASFSESQGLDVCLNADKSLNDIVRSKDFNACLHDLQSSTGMSEKHSFLTCADDAVQRKYDRPQFQRCVKKGVQATMLGYFDLRGRELIEEVNYVQDIIELNPYYWVFKDCEDDGLAKKKDKNEYITFHSDYNIHTDAVLAGAKKKIGGLSAVRFDHKFKKAYFLTDDKGWRGHQRIHVFEYSLKNNRLQLTNDEQITLQLDRPALSPQDTAVPGTMSYNDMDPEGLALLPNGDFIVSAELSDPQSSDFLNIFDSEGNKKGNIELDSSFEKEREDQSFMDSLVGAFSRDGNYRKYVKGLKNNKGLESLSLSPSGRILLTANEAALIQDTDLSQEERTCERTVYPIRGPRERTNGRSRKEKYKCYKNIGDVVRVLSYANDDGEFEQDGVYLYRLDNERDNGLVEILALNESRALTLERSWDPAKRKITAKIYLVDLADEKNLFAPDQAVNNKNLKEMVMTKKLVLNFDEIIDDLSPGFRRLENFEGLAFGPELPNGNPSLVVVSDNNFSRDQRTVLLLLEVNMDALLTAKIK